MQGKWGRDHSRSPLRLPPGDDLAGAGDRAGGRAGLLPALVTRGREGPERSHDVRRIATAAFILLIAAQVIAPAGPGARGEGKEKVQFKAREFEPGAVRLLDGPFREAMLRDQKYLLSLDNDRLLHNFRVNAGLPSSARPLGGWEAPDVELRGHSVGHFLTALALMYAGTGDERFKAKGDALVAELARVQQALPSRGANPGYLSAFPEEFFDRVDKRQRVWPLTTRCIRSWPVCSTCVSSRATGRRSTYS